MLVLDLRYDFLQIDLVLFLKFESGLVFDERLKDLTALWCVHGNDFAIGVIDDAVVQYRVVESARDIVRQFGGDEGLRHL